MYLLDTDICIEFMRDDRKVVGLIRGLKDLHISIITLSELFYGMHNSKNINKHKNIIAKFLTNISILNTNFSLSNNFGIIKTELRKNGFLVGDFDIMTASTAITYDMTLITRNIKHYKNIQGLNIRTI